MSKLCIYFGSANVSFYQGDQGFPRPKTTKERVYSENESLQSEEIDPTLNPEWDFGLVCSNKLRVITFSIQERINDNKTHLVGKFEYFLANLRNEEVGKKIVKDWNLIKAVKDSDELRSSIKMSSGILRLETQYILNKSFIGELEWYQPNLTNKIDETIKQPIYEEISISSMRHSPPKQEKQNTLIDEFNSDSHQFSEVKSKKFKEENDDHVSFFLAEDGALEVKKRQEKVNKIDKKSGKSEQTQQNQLESKKTRKQYFKPQIQPHQMSESIVKETFSRKDQLLIDKMADYILPSENLKMADSLAQNRSRQKLKIFKQIPIFQKNHIEMNKASQMLDVYNMCCAEVEDSQYEVEDEL